MHETAWLDDQEVNTLEVLDFKLSQYDGSHEPLRTTHIILSGAAYVGLAVVLFAILFATQHVPGAEAAFNVFKN